VVTVAIGASGHNPGRWVVGAVLVRREPVARFCRLDDEVTNGFAYWAALDLALTRLDGRAAEILCNSTTLARATQIPGGRYDTLAAGCLERLRRTGSVVRYVGTRSEHATGTDAQWVRWITAEARAQFDEWINTPTTEASPW
jgi:hypothetical protein